MPSLRLENGADIIPLDGISTNGIGVEATAGMGGLGFVGSDVQYASGAGDGARYRGQRALPRDIDLPLYVDGGGRAGLKELVRRLALMFQGTHRLFFVDDRNEEWFIECQRVGGGAFSYGLDTDGITDLSTVVTLRAGMPWWSASSIRSHEVRSEVGVGLLMGGSLTDLQVSDAETVGQIRLSNPGDRPSPGIWTFYGPGNGIQLISPDYSAQVTWDGNLAAGQYLVLDFTTGRVYDQNETNRFDGLGPLPKFWGVPPGESVAVASMNGVQPGVSRVTVDYVPRREVLI